MCDTFVALTGATADGSVIFAKNSDRPAGEAQSVRRYTGQSHPAGARVRCTYIDIPQVVKKLRDWGICIWGAEPR